MIITYGASRQLSMSTSKTLEVFIAAVEKLFLSLLVFCMNRFQRETRQTDQHPGGHSGTQGCFSLIWNYGILSSEQQGQERNELLNLEELCRKLLSSVT